MTVTQQVRNILAAVHKTRNDDKELQIVYMQKSGMQLTPQQVETFRHMPDLWTVRRVRQKLQQHGEYPADPEVDKARFEKFLEVKANISHETPEEALAKLGYRIVTDEEVKEYYAEVT